MSNVQLSFIHEMNKMHTGIVIKYENTDYKRAVQVAHLVLDLLGKSKRSMRDILASSEVKSEALKGCVQVPSLDDSFLMAVSISTNHRTTSSHCVSRRGTTKWLSGKVATSPLLPSSSNSLAGYSCSKRSSRSSHRQAAPAKRASNENPSTERQHTKKKKYIFHFNAHFAFSFSYLLSGYTSVPSLPFGIYFPFALTTATTV